MALNGGGRSRDIIEVVAKANVAENPKFRLTEEEMIDQIWSV